MLWVIGSITVLLIAAYNNVGGAPRAVAQGAEQLVAVPVATGIDTGANLSPRLSEYLLLHQNRYENLPVHAMADVKVCSE
jgi:hypothetical protein